MSVPDGHPTAHAWRGAVRGRRVVPPRPDHFGRSGEIPELYRAYNMDADGIPGACAQALLQDVGWGRSRLIR